MRQPLIEINDKLSPRLNVVERAAGKKLKTEQHHAQMNMWFELNKLLLILFLWLRQSRRYHRLTTYFH